MSPLSKDNYYAIQQLTPEDIAQGKTSIEFKLKRAVGELVFDVMKCDEKATTRLTLTQNVLQL